MQIIVDGLLTQYERIGSGRPMLLLHGWGDSSVSWRIFAQKLATSQYEVILCDLPGFGGSQAPKTAWDLTDYAQFVQAFLAKVDITAAAIIGHSNGGAIAVRGLGTGILHTERLILLASAGVRAKNNKFGFAIAAKAGKLVSSPMPAAWKNKLRMALYDRAGSDMLVAKHLQDTFKLIVADDIREDAGRVKIPTLLIYGASDTATPASYGKQLQQAIHNSKLLVVPNAGHFIHQDAEDQVLATIKEFLQ